ncbi:MAG: hypothetical protein WBL95_19415 [Microcoleus sp.]
MDNIDRIQNKINVATTELLREIIDRLIVLEANSVTNDHKHYSSEVCNRDMIEGLEDRLMEALSVFQSSIHSDLIRLHARHNELIDYLVAAVVEDAAPYADEDYSDKEFKAVVRRLRALRIPHEARLDTL